MVQALFGLAVATLLVNALAGDRGLIQSIEARRQHRWLQTEVERLRLDNDRLRQQARRLREDPAAIEEVARRDLGLIRPGEIIVLLSDIPPTERTRRARLR